MKKNVSSQAIGAQMVSATDGSAFTGSVTVYVTGDAGTQAVGSVGSGACTHEGNGYHTYAPAQAETNYDLIAFTFVGTGAVPATVQVFTFFPQTVDNATNISAIKTKTDYLPSATAGAAGGVFIAGTNAATSITTGLTAHIIGTVDTVTTYTGNTPQTGDAYARLGAPAGVSVSADVAAVKSDTGTILTDVNTGAGAIYTRLGAPAGVSMSADIAAINSKTTNLPADPASTTNITAGTITTTTSVTNTVNADVKKINGVAIVGDGSITPFNV